MALLGASKPHKQCIFGPVFEELSWNRLQDKYYSKTIQTQNFSKHKKISESVQQRKSYAFPKLSKIRCILAGGLTGSSKSHKQCLFDPGLEELSWNRLQDKYYSKTIQTQNFSKHQKLSESVQQQNNCAFPKLSKIRCILCFGTMWHILAILGILGPEPAYLGGASFRQLT